MRFRSTGISLQLGVRDSSMSSSQTMSAPIVMWEYIECLAMLTAQHNKLHQSFGYKIKLQYCQLTKIEDIAHISIATKISKFSSARHILTYRQVSPDIFDEKAQLFRITSQPGFWITSNSCSAHLQSRLSRQAGRRRTRCTFYTGQWANFENDENAMQCVWIVADSGLAVLRESIIETCDGTCPQKLYWVKRITLLFTITNRFAFENWSLKLK